MKLKIYENFSLVRVLFFLLIGSFVCFLFICHYKVVKVYERVDAVVLKEDVVSTYITESTLKLLYKNRFCLFKNKKISITIEKVNLDMFKQKHNIYHQVILSFPKKEALQVNDTISLFFYEKKISFLVVFYQLWKGD